MPRLRERWKEYGDAFGAKVRQRRAQTRARAATAAPVSWRRIGYPTEYHAVEAVARRQAEMEMHRRNMALLAPVLRMEEDLRQLQRLGCLTPSW